MTPKPLMIGTKTNFGTVQAVMFRHRDQERYYMCLDKQGVVGLIPASAIETKAEPLEEKQ